MFLKSVTELVRRLFSKRVVVQFQVQLCFLKCNSHPPSLRLIVIAEKDVVYNKFPIPLINRLEKHYLVTLTCLTPDQMELVDKLRTWVSDFSEVTRESKRNR